MNNTMKFLTAMMLYTASGLACYAWILTDSNAWMVATMVVKFAGHTALLSMSEGVKS